MSARELSMACRARQNSTPLDPLGLVKCGSSFTVYVPRWGESGLLTAELREALFHGLLRALYSKDG